MPKKSSRSTSPKAVLWSQWVGQRKKQLSMTNDPKTGKAVLGSVPDNLPLMERSQWLSDQRSMENAVELQWKWGQAGRNVFVLSPELAQHLTARDTDAVSLDVLRALPLDSFYVWEGVALDDLELDGFFFSSDDDRICISCLLSDERGDIELWAVGEAGESVTDFLTRESSPNGVVTRGQAEEILSHVVGVLLYLSAENAEISPDPMPSVPKRALAKAFKRDRLKPTYVGWREGASITASLRRAIPSSEGHHGKGTPKAPHMRRAHWHTYRVGEGRRDTQIRWVAPVFVNGADYDGETVTVRSVRQ